MVGIEFIFIVMWESLTASECSGGDYFMSRDYDKAKEFMNNKAAAEQNFSYTWDEENDMWISRWKYGWDKLYIDSRELDMEY